MVTIAEKRRWKTKPLDCWQKYKEATKRGYANVSTAKQRGEIFSLWGMYGRGFAPFRGLSGENYAAQAAAMGLSAELAEAAEARGYARDLCAYARINLGSMFLNKYAFGGPFPKPDIVIRSHMCDTHGKWALLEAEYLKVPFYATEGADSNEFDSEQSRKNKIEYRIAQTLDAIEWIEKTTGRKFNDEAYIEELYNSARCQNLWGQVCLFNQNIPAPLDEKSLYALFTLVGNEGKEHVELRQMLRDEVEDRVRNEIAAVATERYRVMHVSQPPWYALKVFRYMQKYGAVSIGSRYTFGATMLKAGREFPIPTLEECGIVLKNREDAVRVSVERQEYLDDAGTPRSPRFAGRPSMESQVRLARLWHCDGAVLHYNRGCEGLALGLPQFRLALQENNIPVLTYEGNVADVRDWDEARTLARMDAFFESQGLEKLED